MSTNEPTERTKYNFGFRRVTTYTPEELDIAVKIAREECQVADLDFYAIMRGVDSYFEKRRRKEAAEH
jgi:hypothetical protein